MPSDNDLHQPCDSDIFQVSDQGGSEVGVDMQAANSDVDTPHVKNDTPPEGMNESEVDASDLRDDGNHEVEEGGATYQSQRPVRVRRPPTVMASGFSVVSKRSSHVFRRLKPSRIWKRSGSGN